MIIIESEVLWCHHYCETNTQLKISLRAFRYALHYSNTGRYKTNQSVYIIKLRKICIFSPCNAVGALSAKQCFMFFFLIIYITGQYTTLVPKN